MSIDVYLYGIVTPSTVYVLREDFSFPEANAYAEVAETLPSIGGEAANSAIVLARLGLRTRLDGNWLNARRAGEVTSKLGSYGIDVARLTVVDSGGTDEFVVADRRSRTVFGNYAGFHGGPQQWNEARPEDVKEASIVCLDPYFGAASARAAELCVQLDRPYVTQDSPCEDFVAQHAACVVVSHEGRAAYPGRDHRELFEAYLERCAGLVVFSFGGDEVWYGRHGEAASCFEPYRIEPVDTTGAGDSFRGALAYGLLRGWSDLATVDFAAAVAACVCMSYPHALNAPDLAGVTEFMARYGRRPGG